MSQDAAMQPLLSQVCTLSSPFDVDVRDFAAGQCRGIEVWWTKLESFLESHSVEDVRRLLDEEEVQIPVASYQGGLLDSQGDKRREAWELFQRRLKLCAPLGIETVVVAADVQQKVDGQVLERVQMSLGEVARAAETHDLHVALEFQASSRLGNNLQTAVALVDEVGSERLGICFDVFQFFTGPSKWSDLELLTASSLKHVQLSDLADVPRELASDAHRILPGDGDLPLAELITWLRERDYRGTVSVELMNRQIWQIPALQFGEVGLTALRRILGLADAS